jgi:hypothetical protein
MSEFTCKKGHIMNGCPYCPVCGGPVHYMDGDSNRDIEIEEEEEEEEENKS